MIIDWWVHIYKSALQYCISNSPHEIEVYFRRHVIWTSNDQNVSSGAWPESKHQRLCKLNPHFRQECLPCICVVPQVPNEFLEQLHNRGIRIACNDDAFPDVDALDILAILQIRTMKKKAPWSINLLIFEWNRWEGNVGHTNNTVRWIRDSFFPSFRRGHSRYFFLAQGVTHGFTLPVPPMSSLGGRESHS